MVVAGNLPTAIVGRAAHTALLLPDRLRGAGEAIPESVAY
jgi:hypothetical protein